jgi:hypothetical protein
MAAEPSTSLCGKQKAIPASNLTVDEVNKILQNCELGQSDKELSDSESYSDINRIRS